MRNPSWNNWDMSVSKRIPLASEQRYFQLRGEFYNIWNHTQFNGVNTTAQFDAPEADHAAFGQLSGTRVERSTRCASCSDAQRYTHSRQI
jgi:hypothetical protein